MTKLKRALVALGCFCAMATSTTASALTQTFTVNPDQDGIARLALGSPSNGIEIERNMNYRFSLTVESGTLNDYDFGAYTLDYVARIRNGQQYNDYVLYGDVLNYRQTVLPNGLMGSFKTPPDATEPPDLFNERAFIYDSKAFYWGDISARSDGPASFTFTLTASPAPEPTTWALMIGGFGAVGVMARRRAAHA